MVDLVTRAEYKAYAGISSSNSDPEIDAMIPRISAFIKKYCKRAFVDYTGINPATNKIELNNGGFDSIVLAEAPILAVSLVELSIDYGQTYTALVQYTDWYLSEGLLKPITVTEFPYYPNGYKVTYTAGFTSIPEDLKLAAFDLLTYYRKNDSNVHAVRQINSSTMQIEYISNTALPSHIKRVLDNYILDYA